MTEDHEKEEPTKLSVLSVIGSAFSAALGVQNSKNRERDFKSGKMMPFIIAGVVFTLLFIGTVFTVVQIVLKNAGH
jgi:hypothetical protein